MVPLRPLAAVLAAGVILAGVFTASPLSAQYPPQFGDTASYQPHAGPEFDDQMAYFFHDEPREFNPDIPTPQEFLGYEMGAHHTRYDRIVDYFQELARLSDRAELQTIGQTFGLRPLIVLTVATPDHHDNLEQIRREHLQAVDLQGGSEGDAPAVSERPVITHLGYGVHGNETSSSEVAMLAAYYLVAGQDDQVAEYLDNGIFHIEPALNPDGRDRHTHWANMHKANPFVADRHDREHNEAWPGGRTNHYWFDLNRDWLPLVNPESQARIDFHHSWKPNVVTDFHEMGTNSTYFFEPTEPELSWNPLIPERLYTDITMDFAEFYAAYLDDIGTAYWTEEDIFDNSYPGYGSTYPNFLGGLGLVFEQASARGHLQESTHHGELSFAYAIRNQLRTSLATIESSVTHRQKLLDYQQDFYRSGLEEATEHPVQAFVFGDRHDETRNRAFLDLLLRHRIDVYELQESREYDGQRFEAGSAWVVPVSQQNYRLVRTIFDRSDRYTGSAGSRASAWTMSLAYGLPDAEIRDGDIPQGESVSEVPEPENLGQVPQSDYAYLIDWSDYAAPKALYHLQKHGVHAEAAFRPFTARTNSGKHDYSRGSISIPVQVQDMDRKKLHELVLEAEQKAGLAIQSTDTGMTLDGIDLGSGNFRPLERQRALMIVGDGTSSTEAGEVWHLLDQRVNMPITKVDSGDFSRVQLSDYDVLVMVSGGYGFLEEDRMEDIQRWVGDGGTLIALRHASQWVVENDLAPRVDPDQENEEQPEEQQTRPERLAYERADSLRTRERIAGVITEVDLDISHPVGFGYERRQLPVWRSHNRFLPPSENPYSTVARYAEEPRMSGYLSDDNQQKLAGSAAVLADRYGSGSVLLFMDNPNFRGFWYGTNRMFFNALFFGQHIRVPAAP